MNQKQSLPYIQSFYFLKNQSINPLKNEFIRIFVARCHSFREPLCASQREPLRGQLCDPIHETSRKVYGVSDLPITALNFD